jgi:hypothetical protein
MNEHLLLETRDLLNELLEKCEGQLFDAVDLDTLEPNELGDRALRLLDRIDDALSDRLPGVVSRIMSRLRKGA